MACCSGDRYGSFVRQLLVDYEDPLEVNNQLETMGYNIGVRLVDDFFAKSKISASIRTKNPGSVVCLYNAWNSPSLT
jgi:trafficking protein particle complex subunit 3